MQILELNLLNAINKALKQLNCESELKTLHLEIAPDRFKDQFDLATNAAIGLIKINKINLEELKNTLKSQTIQDIDNIDVINPGFINIKLSSSFFHRVVTEINKNSDQNIIKNIGNNKTITIDFCHPNPTGPMHIGHLRAGFFGDAICNILDKSGYKVTREYFVNDAGGQIEKLTDSAIFRCKQVLSGDFSQQIPEGCYPGDYLIDIAQNITKSHDFDSLSREELKKLTIQEIMKNIKNTLSNLKINYHIFASEQDIRDSGIIDKAIDVLKSKDLVYYGQLPKPKDNEEDDEWEAETQLLFRSTKFGDDMDRVLKRSDNSITYCAADIGYHYQKFLNGFDRMILLLGADHKGHAKKTESAIREAIDSSKTTFEIKFLEMVNFIKEGKPVKMSKRAGNFLLADDVIKEIELDVLRFMMLTRRAETILNFDFDLAIQQTKENPIFYIQYAHSRCCSIIKNANVKIDVSKITNTKIPNHLKKITTMCALYPRFIELSAIHLDPYFIANFLLELVTEFHVIWSLGSENKDMKFISDDKELTNLNLSVVKMTKEIIGSALKILNITPVESM